jgi:hypothetical protein
MAEQLGAKAEVAVGSTRRPEPMREGRRKGVCVTMEDGESETARCSREPETETERRGDVHFSFLHCELRHEERAIYEVEIKIKLIPHVH